MTFIEKLKAAQTATRSMLCIGLDPDIGKMPSGLSRDSQGALNFCKAIIDSTADIVSAFKPNLAFFLAHGADGIDALQQVIAQVPASVPTILDAKFGDIGNTAEHYAAFAFDRLGADAVTVSPYIGTDAIRPFLEYSGKLVFVLARTSNTAGNEFQSWPDAANPLYRRVAQRMVALAGEFPGQVGLVVGATQPAELTQLRAAALDLPFLVPGVGAQGGDLAAAMRDGTTRGGIGPVINVSRAVIYASQGSDFAQAARDRALAFGEQMRRIMSEPHDT